MVAAPGPKYRRAMTVKVLVVDDTYTIRRTLGRLLAYDYDVDLAESGEEALAQLDDSDHDVIVIDQVMPGLDGIATAREICLRRPGQKIILYTAFLDGAVEEEALEAGVACCVPKAEGLLTLDRDIRSLTGSIF